MAIGMLALTHQNFGLFLGLLSLTVLREFGLIPMNPLFIAIYLILVWIGSLLCDIDTSQSKISKMLWFIIGPVTFIFGKEAKWVSWMKGIILSAFTYTYLEFIESPNKFFITIIVILLYIICRLLARKLQKLFSHRKFTHSLVFVYIITLSFYLVLVVFGLNPSHAVFCTLGLTVGILSHIAGDALTINGVPIFYPYKGKEPGTNKKRKQSKRYRFPVYFKTGSQTESVILGVLMVANSVFLLVLAYHVMNISTGVVVKEQILEIIRNMEGIS